jgi:hypothetical protein
LETWKKPLLQTINESDEYHIRLLNKYFLPFLSKECPRAFTDLIQSMANEIIETKRTTGLQALMLCFNIARREKLLPDDRPSPRSYNQSNGTATVAFSEMGLPKTFFHSLLTNESPTVRLGAFDLLTFHTHQKTPLSDPCLTLIQQILPSMYTEQDPEFRVETLRSIRNLLLRLRASTHSAAKDLERRISQLGDITQELRQQLARASRFVHWLVEFCGECVFPGRTFPMASMGLKTLHLLCEEGFLTDVDVEVKSGVLSGVHVKLFSEVRLRALLDRLVDPYDEVARLAGWLVERVMQPERIPWGELFERGRTLCLSGRADKSEGGARILRLVDQFSRVNGIEGVWEQVRKSLVNDIKGGDLNLVAGERPFHGRLVCLRYPPQYLS